MTPLHISAIVGNIEIVKLLCNRNAYINEKDSYGDTPLHCACLNKNIDIVKLLIDYGADITIENSIGNTYARYISKYNQIEIENYASGYLDIKQPCE